MPVCRGLYELAGDANAVAGLSDAAFKDITHAEVAADLLDIDGLAFVGKAGIAHDHEQRLEARQCGDDVFRHTVGEIFLFDVPAHVLKRQHRDGRLVGKRQRPRSVGRRLRLFRCYLPRRGERLVDPRSPCAHSLGDVFQDLRTNTVEGDIDLAANLALSIVRNADAAGFGGPLQPSGNVDAVTENVVVVYDDVADVDADPEFDPQLTRHIAVLPRHAILNFDCAARRIDRAGEFHQQAVTGGLDDASVMLGNSRIDDGFSECLSEEFLNHMNHL